MQNVDSVSSSPFFSICIPVYNGEAYIKKAITSILNQTFKDWELVIIEDGSTDRTWTILQEFSNHPQIRLFRNDGNLGQGKNGNRFLTLVKGVWMGFLAADDVYVAHTLETIHSVTAGRNEVFLWAHGHICLGEKHTPDTPLPFHSMMEFSGREAAEMLYLKGNIFGEISNYFFKVAAQKKYPECLFLEDTSYHDTPFWIGLSFRNETGVAIYWPETLSRILIHGESVSSDNQRTGRNIIEVMIAPVRSIKLAWRQAVLLRQIARTFWVWFKFRNSLPNGHFWDALHTICALCCKLTGTWR